MFLFLSFNPNLVSIVYIPGKHNVAERLAAARQAPRFTARGRVAAHFVVSVFPACGFNVENCSNGDSKEASESKQKMRNLHMDDPRCRWGAMFVVSFGQKVINPEFY